MSNTNRELEFLPLFHRNLNMPTLDSIINDIKNHQTVYDSEIFAKESNKHLIIHECVQFKQHRCSYHKPYTCFFWHFENQRRRFPYAENNKEVVYRHDNVCKSYNSMTGICKNGTSCDSVHHIYGDMERLFHPFYFKTTKCMYKTNDNGLCKKNGIYCAFSHGPNDFRDLKMIYEGTNVQYDFLTNFVFNSMHPNGKNLSCENDIKNGENLSNGNSCQNWDWIDLRYIIKNYKTVQCSQNHSKEFDIVLCPFYHNPSDQRRNPYYFKYESTKCKYVFQNKVWDYRESCPDSHLCQYSHNNFECRFHPDNYKRKPCISLETNKACTAKSFCPFRHSYKSKFNEKTNKDIKTNALNFLARKSSFMNDSEFETLTESFNWQSSLINEPTVTNKVFGNIKDKSCSIDQNFNGNNHSVSQMMNDFNSRTRTDSVLSYQLNLSNSFNVKDELSCQHPEIADIFDFPTNTIYQQTDSLQVPTNTIYQLTDSNPLQVPTNNIYQLTDSNPLQVPTNTIYQQTDPLQVPTGMTKTTSKSMTSFDMIDNGSKPLISQLDLDQICDIIDDLTYKIRPFSLLIKALKSTSIKKRYSTLKSFSTLKSHINKIIPDEPNKKICLLCVENECDLLFLPCTHFVACSDCFLFNKENYCPLCQNSISETISLKKNI